jgi:hypothetical protein
MIVAQALSVSGVSLKLSRRTPPLGVPAADASTACIRSHPSHWYSCSLHDLEMTSIKPKTTRCGGTGGLFSCKIVAAVDKQHNEQAPTGQHAVNPWCV